MCDAVLDIAGRHSLEPRLRSREFAVRPLRTQGAEEGLPSAWPLRTQRPTAPRGEGYYIPDGHPQALERGRAPSALAAGVIWQPARRTPRS